MLSEAAHSVADTTTEVLLFLALRRGAQARRRATPVRVRQGELRLGVPRRAVHLRRRRRLRRSPTASPRSSVHEHSGDYLVSYSCSRSPSSSRSISLARARAAGRAASPGAGGPRRARFLRLTADTTVKAVFLEDSAALIGLLLAARRPRPVRTLTGDELWDGVASIADRRCCCWWSPAILARSNVSLLVGRAVPRAAAPARSSDELAGAARRWTAIDTLLTMQLGPERHPGRREGRLPRRGHRRARSRPPPTRPSAGSPDRYPEIRYVFLDPTRRCRARRPPAHPGEPADAGGPT